VKTSGVKVLDTLIHSAQRSKPSHAMIPKKTHYGANGYLYEYEEEVHEFLLGPCEQHLPGVAVDKEYLQIMKPKVVKGISGNQQMSANISVNQQGSNKSIPYQIRSSKYQAPSFDNHIETEEDLPYHLDSQ
jgi:hypothetical protein